MAASTRIYFLTFIAYVSLHALRTVYSYSKPYFQKEYHLPKMYLAVLDSSIYIFLGLGFLIRSPIVSQNNLKQHFIITSLLSGLCYTLFPLLAAINLLNSTNIYQLLLLLMIGYGFFQLNFWPTILYIFKDYFNNQEDGCLIGFWSSAGDFGNILGFLCSSLLLLRFNVRWQAPLLIFSAILLIMSTIVYFFAHRKQQKQNPNQIDLQITQIQLIGVNNISWLQYWQFIKHSICQIKTALFFLCFCLFKAMLYVFLLWLPTYLDSKGHQQLSAYIPILFNLATIIGSFLIGKLYQKDQKKQSNQIMAQIVLAIAGIIVIIGLVVIISTEFNPKLFAIVVMVQGFAIGGVFNILACNETIRIAGEDPKQLDLVTSFSMGVGGLAVGLVELLVGLSLGREEDREGLNSGYDSVFQVQLAVAILAALCLMVRAYLIYRDQATSYQKPTALQSFSKQVQGKSQLSPT